MTAALLSLDGVGSAPTLVADPPAPTRQMVPSSPLALPPPNTYRAPPRVAAAASWNTWGNAGRARADRPARATARSVERSAASSPPTMTAPPPTAPAAASWMGSARSARWASATANGGSTRAPCTADDDPPGRAAASPRWPWPDEQADADTTSTATVTAPHTRRERPRRIPREASDRPLVLAAGSGALTCDPAARTRGVSRGRPLRLRSTGMSRGLTFGIKTRPEHVAYQDIVRVWQEADEIAEIEHA